MIVRCVVALLLLPLYEMPLLVEVRTAGEPILAVYVRC